MWGDSAGSVGWAECDGCRGVESRVKKVVGKRFWDGRSGAKKEGGKAVVSFVCGLGGDSGR